MASFTWNNLSCSVGDIQILHAISGNISHGQMYGIIGGSGAGKTTLLTILGNRLLKHKIVTGTICYDNQVIDSNWWRSSVAFVEQEEEYYLQLTVRETLLFQARLKLSNMTSQQWNERIEDIVRKLNMTHALDRRIINLSGGEKKRVSIAKQVLGFSKLLLLDEPTSGLDSFTSSLVVQMLRKLCDQENLIIIMTIHMPRSDIIQMYDKIMCLHKGQITFDGTMRCMYTFWNNIGYPAPEHANPADYLIDLSNTHVDLASAWKEYTSSRYSSLIDIQQCGSTRPSIAIGNTTFAWWLTQISVLTERNMLNLWRNKGVIITAAVQTLSIILLVGFVFFQLPTNQASIQSRYGVLFFILVNQTFAYMSPLVTTFPMEMKLIKQDYYSGAYKPWIAFMARFITQWSLAMITSTVVSITLFFMIGLNGLAIYYIVLQLVMMCAIALGLTIGASVTSHTIAQTLAPTVAIALILVAGLYSNRATIPSAIAWLRYISFVSYAYTILFVNEFESAQFTCTAADSRCFTRGSQIITFFGMNTPSTAINFVGILSILFILLLAGMIFLSMTIVK